jgi:TRAP-type C4-dicarboxylate transport system permease small subunit
VNRIAALACRLGAAVSAAAILAIVLVVLAQVGCRLLGIVTQGLDEVVAWLTAAACVSGFGYAFRHGAHVRVELLTDRLRGRWARGARLASLAAALVIASFAAYSCTLMAWESYAFHDLGQGVIALPLWIPQSALALGTVTLALAVLASLAEALAACRAPADARAAPLGAAAEI